MKSIKFFFACVLALTFVACSNAEVTVLKIILQTSNPCQLFGQRHRSGIDNVRQLIYQFSGGLVTFL